MFFYTPYPGNPLAARLAESGFAPPQTLNAWARFDLGTRAGPWIHARLRRQVEAYRFYLRTGFSNGPWWRAPQRVIARLRCRHRRLELPIEQKLVDWIKAPLGET